MDTVQTSLARAYSFVAQDLGLSFDTTNYPDAFTDEVPPLTAMQIKERGHYGTYPYESPSIVAFDNGNWYYVINPVDKLVVDLDYVHKPMGVFGTPVAWISYQKAKAPAMVYVDLEVDGIHYKSYGSPRKMYVAKADVTKIDFGNGATNLRDFTGVPGTEKHLGDMVRIIGVASYPAYPAIPNGQQFYMDMDDWGEFTRTGKVAKLQGYFVGDISIDKPKIVERSVRVANSLPPASRQNITVYPPLPTRTHQTSDILPVSKVPSTPEAYHFRPLQQNGDAVRYRVMQRYIVQDYTYTGKAVELTKGKTIKILGSFQHKGRTFLLPELDNPAIPRFTYMYGVPEIVQGKRIVEELPDYTDLKTTEPTIVEREYLKTVRLSDHFVHLATKLEVKLEHGILKVKGFILPKK